MGTRRNLNKLTINKFTGERKMGSDLKRDQVLNQSANRMYKDEKRN